jgi:hypothetical protein
MTGRSRFRIVRNSLFVLIALLFVVGARLQAWGLGDCEGFNGDLCGTVAASVTSTAP